MVCCQEPNGQQLKRDHRHRSYAFTYSKLGGISKEIMKSDHARVFISAHCMISHVSI